MKTVIATIFSLVTVGVFAQQESQYLNAINNSYLLNPAAAGLSNVAHIELTSRTQWVGYNGPQTFCLTANSPIKFKSGGDKSIGEYNIEDKAFFSSPTATTGKLKHVAGGKVLNDRIGPFSKTSVYGSYGIHLPFSKKLNFGVGLGLGWSNFKVIQERVTLYQEDDAAYAQFLSNTSAQNFLDANAGFIFYNDQLMIGLSSTQIFKNKASFGNVMTESFYNRHYFVSARYRFDFDNKMSLEPQVLAKFADNSPASLDAGVRVWYNRAIWLGLQYRTSNAFEIQIGANLIKNLYLNYGYELATGPTRIGNNGTHEVQLGIYIGNNRNMNKEIKDTKEKHPGH